MDSLVSNALGEKDIGRSFPVGITHYLKEGSAVTLVWGAGGSEVEQASPSYIDRVRNMVDDYQRQRLEWQDVDEESELEVQIPFLSTISLN